MPKIKITRKEPTVDKKNPRDWLTHPDNPEQVEMAVERLFPRGTTQKNFQSKVALLEISNQEFTQ